MGGGGGRFISFDNREENRGIAKRYNEFLNTYDYSQEAWFMFCHEDFEILEPIEGIEQRLSPQHIYAPLGTRYENLGKYSFRSIYGEMKISNKDGSHCRLVGICVEEATVVDTFDCQCFFVHSSLIQKYSLRFDEELAFDWYVEDFCIGAKEYHNISSYVIPIQCQHYSYGEIQQRFYDALEYLQKKYSTAQQHYSSTCTDITIPPSSAQIFSRAKKKKKYRFKNRTHTVYCIFGFSFIFPRVRYIIKKM